MTIYLSLDSIESIYEIRLVHELKCKKLFYRVGKEVIQRILRRAVIMDLIM